MKKQQFGVVGLGVMGQNLARNIARNGYSVAGLDLDPAKVTAATAKFAGSDIVATASKEEFASSGGKTQEIGHSDGHLSQDFVAGWPVDHGDTEGYLERKSPKDGP